MLKTCPKSDIAPAALCRTVIHGDSRGRLGEGQPATVTPRQSPVRNRLVQRTFAAGLSYLAHEMPAEEVAFEMRDFQLFPNTH